MSHRESQTQLLNLVNRPAFYAKDGVITYANQAAASMLLVSGIELAPYLPFDIAELETLPEGSLCTVLTFGGHSHPANVTSHEEGFLFLLDSQEDLESLRTLALAAQQLRMPLNDLLGESVELFSYFRESPETMDRSRRMMQNMMQLLRIVGNMADAREFSANPTGFMERVELNSLFDEIFQKAANLAEPLGVSIAFTPAKQAIKVWGDIQQLERCVLNLLANALRFTPQGGRVQARLQALGTQAILRMEDSGEGLHEAVKTTLFDRYSREPALEDSRYGLGLGLMLCRMIATNHGGALFIGPGKSGGTAAVLSLPIREDKSENVLSMPMRVDYTGSWDHALVELSGVLPPEAMDYL